MWGSQSLVAIFILFIYHAPHPPPAVPPSTVPTPTPSQEFPPIFFCIIAFISLDGVLIRFLVIEWAFFCALISWSITLYLKLD